MTDIITTGTGVEVAPISFVDNRVGAVGEIARAQAAERAALARVAEVEAENTRLRTEQITDGDDPRLVDFWEKAGRIADHANFCEEYDRLAEALNGTPREREWVVNMDVSVSVRVSRTVTARNADEAVESAEEILDREDVAEQIRNWGWDDIDFDSSEAERA